MSVVLYNYFRSSTSHRVRIALELKGIAFGYEAVHLRRGEQSSERFRSLNPQGLVPALTWTDGKIYTQSLAIIEFLDEVVPAPPLLPSDPVAKARVRGLAYMIAMDIHPINNLRVLGYLRREFGADDAAIARWFAQWVKEAFGPLEYRLANEPETGVFCHGDQISLADICLIAQVTSNLRFNIDLSPYPTIQRVSLALSSIEAVRRAAPDEQPDSE
jgi:maleylpyruvate isomerase